MQEILQWIISKLNVQTPHGRFFIVFRGPWNFTMNLPKMSVESCFEHFPSWTFTNFDTTKLGERHCEWRFFHFVENWRCTFCRLILQGPFHSKKWCVFVLLLPTKENVPLRGEGLGFAYDLGSGKKLTRYAKRLRFPPLKFPGVLQGAETQPFRAGFYSRTDSSQLFHGGSSDPFLVVRAGNFGLRIRETWLPRNQIIEIKQLLKLLAIPRKGKNDLKR